MSRLARNPVIIPYGIKIYTENESIVFDNGSLIKKLDITEDIKVDYANGQCIFKLLNKNNKGARSQIGTIVATLKTMIADSAQPYKTTIALVGVGFKAFLVNNIIIFSLGYSHMIAVEIPVNVKTTVGKDSKIEINGMRAEVMRFAAILKKLRQWDPCLQKGVIIEGEFLFKKESKKKK